MAIFLSDGHHQIHTCQTVSLVGNSSSGTMQPTGAPHGPHGPPAPPPGFNISQHSPAAILRGAMYGPTIGPPGFNLSQPSTTLNTFSGDAIYPGLQYAGNNVYSYGMNTSFPTPVGPLQPSAHHQPLAVNGNNANNVTSMASSDVSTENVLNQQVVSDPKSDASGNLSNGKADSISDEIVQKVSTILFRVLQTQHPVGWAPAIVTEV